MERNPEKMYNKNFPWKSIWPERTQGQYNFFFYLPTLCKLDNGWPYEITNIHTYHPLFD